MDATIVAKLRAGMRTDVWGRKKTRNLMAALRIEREGAAEPTLQRVQRTLRLWTTVVANAEGDRQ